MRKQGKTTKAILHAPEDCFFICMNYRHVKYCKDLAEKLNRKDIKFISVLELNKDYLIGRYKSEVLIDHAVGWNYSDEIMEFMQYNMSRPPKPK